MAIIPYFCSIMSNSPLKERTAKGLFWGGLSGGVQQVLALVIGIVLARHLLPQDYGMVAMLTVFSLLAANLEDSGFTSAIAVKKSAGNADYNAVLWFSVAVGVVLYILLWFAAPLISAFNRTPELTLLARVSFAGFVVSSFGIAQSAYLFRNLMVKQRMIATFTAVCAGGAVGITLVVRGYAYWGLVAQDLTYKSTIVVMYWVLSPWRPTRELSFRPIREMFGFSSRILATNVLTTLNNQFLQAQLGHWFPRHEVGLYSQANKWDTMGYSLITTTLSSVAQPVLAKAAGESRQKQVFRKMVRFTAFLAFPAMWGLAAIAPEFVPLALKSQWAACVPYLQTLCVAGAFIPVSQLYSNLLISRGRSSVFFAGTASMMLCQLAIILALHFLGHGVGILLVFIAALQASWLAVWHTAAHREIGLRLTDTLRDIAPFALASAASMAAACLAAEAVSGSAARLAVKIAVAAACYCAIMHFAHAAIFRESVDFILHKMRKIHKSQ